MSSPPPAPDAVAWLDVTAGVSGDMLLGAFVDAGADLAEIQRHVDSAIPDTVHLVRSEVIRAGFLATKVDVHLLVEDQPHRSWAEIRERLTGGAVHPDVGELAGRVFGRLADVEGRVHGVPVDAVHFHEVGAWDSIADVVGVCAGMVQLGVVELVVSSIALGSGTVRTAHGQLPVPVPAVLGLVPGWTVHEGGAGELATPTGVAVLVTLASRQGSMPPMRVGGQGVGAGTRDPAGRPNVVRLVVGTPAELPVDAALRTPSEGELPVMEGVPEPTDGSLQLTEMVLLEANVDDLDPRVWPTVLAALLEAGAADAWLVPIVMKKGRPAHTLCVLVPLHSAQALRDAALALTSTLGVRELPVRRWALARGWADVFVDGVAVAVKVAHRDGVIVHATAEFDDVAAAAEQLGRPVRDVLEAASAAAVGLGLVQSAPAPDGLLRSTAR